MSPSHRNHGIQLESIHGAADHQCRVCRMVDELIEELVKKQSGDAHSPVRGNVIPIRRKLFQEPAQPRRHTLPARLNTVHVVRSHDHGAGSLADPTPIR